MNWAAVADGAGLLDVAIAGQGFFNELRGDVLAAGGDDQLLAAASDAQVAFAVKVADVAGVEPAVAEGGCVFLWAVPVAGGDVSVPSPESRPRC